MTVEPQNNNLNYSIDPTFPNVNRLFALSFEIKIIGDDRDSFSNCYVPNVEIKDFHVLIGGNIFFDLPVKNEEETSIMMTIQRVIYWILLILKKITD